MSARAPRRAWRLALLLPHPPLSLLYLFAIRSGRLPPLLAVAVGLAILPLLSLLLGFRLGAGEASERQRRGDFLVTALGVVEIFWALVCIAIVNIAVAWRLS